MASVNQFTFHLSSLATSPAPHPDNSPTQHLLPPEPIYVRNQHGTTGPSVRYSRQSSPRQEADVTLGNSPQFSNSRGASRQVRNISHFNKKLNDSKGKDINSNSRAIRNESSNSPSRFAISRSRDLNTTINKEESIYHSKEYVPGPYYVMTDREKRGNTYLADSQTDRLRQSSSKSRYCEVCNPAKRSNESSPSKKITKVSEQKLMLQKMDEIRLKMAQLQSVNLKLTSQLEATRQKLKAKEAECNLLRSKNEEYASLSSNRAQHNQIRQNLELQIRQLKQLNQELCRQIDQLKKQIVHHQSKNTQSLRLLQKLNDNISENEKILQKELNEQKLITANLAEQKNRLQIEYTHVIKTCQELEGQRVRLIKATEDLVAENSRLGQLISKNQEKQFEKTIQDLKNQLRALEYQSHKSEEKSIITLNQLRMKQEDYGKLSRYVQELKRQKAEIVELNEEDRIKASRKFERQTFELKTAVNNYKEDIERLTYQNKELEMKIFVQNEENDKNIQEISDLKIEIRTLQREKDELRNQCGDLSDRLNKISRDLQYARQRQNELTNTISSYQRDLLQTEQSVKEHLDRLANRDHQFNKLKEAYEAQMLKNERLLITIEEKTKIILNLQENLKKEGKVVLLYKEGLAKLQEKKEIEWSNMNKVYIEQIKKLEQTIKQLMEYNDSKRMSRISAERGGGHRTLSFSYQSSSSPLKESIKKVEGGTYTIDSGQVVQIVESQAKYS